MVLYFPQAPTEEAARAKNIEATPITDTIARSLCLAGGLSYHEGRLRAENKKG